MASADDAERGAWSVERGIDPTFRWDFDLAFAGEECAGDAACFVGDFVGSAEGDDFAAADAGAGAEVDEVVGGPHRVFVVLDDDDRVAEVAELGERVEQALVVARVEADRGFVEDVEHADEAAADLAGEADALRFAAGERGGGAVEREVVEADVLQEAEAAADFFQDFGGDQFVVAFELQLAEELGGVGDREIADFGQRCGAGRSAKRGLAVWIVTAQACGLSRRPAQSGQRMMLMYCSSWSNLRLRSCWCCIFRAARG